MTDQSVGEPVEVKGACLCGNVSYEASLQPGAGACHCAMCRKWAGGLLMAVHAIGAVDFSGSEHIAVYRSSDWAERGFCKNCGSNLFYHLRPRPFAPNGEYMLSAGSVSDQSVLQFDHEVYVDHAPGWYRFADEAKRKRLTEADVLAMYAPEV